MWLHADDLSDAQFLGWEWQAGAGRVVPAARVAGPQVDVERAAAELWFVEELVTVKVVLCDRKSVSVTWGH